MPSRLISYSHSPDETIELVDSKDLFVLKLRKHFEEEEITNSFKILEKFKDSLRLKASFPESASYVYQVTGLLKEEVRNAIKENIKNVVSDNFEYVGNVKEYAQNGIYQIYTGNLFLKFNDRASHSFIGKVLKKHNLTPKINLNFAPNSYFLDTPKGLEKDIFDLSLELLNFEEVDYCHPELVVNQRSYLENNQNGIHRKFTGNRNEWVFEKTKIFEAWKYTKGENIKICVIDDGIDFNLPVFNQSGKVLSPKDMHDLEGKRIPQHQYFEKHGTAVSSIAVSNDENAMGVAPNSQLIPIRATSLGSVLQSEAFYWAANSGADIISCSWGPPDSSLFDFNRKNLSYPIPPHTELAIKYATEKGRNGKGCVVFFAAGNGKERFSNDGYASHKNVLAIGATNKEDKATVYSDYGAPILCCFPSGDYTIKNGNDLIKKPYGLTVLDPIGSKGYADGNYYEFFDGTSASCPGVAGITALILSINKDLTREEVKEILKKSCKKIGPKENYINGYSQEFGNGLIQADLAIKFANKSLKNKTMKAISLHIGINLVDQKYYHNYVPPLYGCINDMDSMIRLANSLGYQTNSLPNSSATKTGIANSIVTLGNSLQDGGILLITYSGHGAPIPNKDEQEFDDGENDESWVAYDGFLLDDEIHNSISKITKKIRVLVISDSCHSQSVTKMYNPNGNRINYRAIPEAAVREILRTNGSSIEKIRASIHSRVENNQISTINISACKEDELAKEVDSQGVFTQVLLNVFNEIKASNDKSANYSGFTQSIARQLSDPSQNPNITTSHFESIEFLNQFPFQIDNNSTLNNETGSNSSANLVNPAISKREEMKNNEIPKKIETNNLMIGDDVFEIDSSSRSINSSTNWDLAYEKALELGQVYVEPEVISCLHSTLEGERGTNKDDGYLDTYPAPPSSIDSQSTFVWHLDEEHSQLKAANELVFPEICSGSENASDTDNLVKIAHIDTGVLEFHPTHPVNMEKPVSCQLFNNDKYGYDLDKFLSIAETQGHGQATASILAGPWVDYDVTNSEYRGFFGAIPYAKVLPIKISETVALLSGRNFAKAVDHAIEQGCDVITMSMAGLPSKIMAKAVNRAYDAGVVIVAAGSNSFSKGLGRVLPKKTMYPARYDRTIAAVGTTFTHKPYLNSFYEKLTRAAGGRYMQSCFGPVSALPSSLAAYTPNITWFNKNDTDSSGKTKYYVKSGGGTSSATPQIAAAAALYIQKYKNDLESIAKKKGAWAKAEIVRQALFLSADKKHGFLDIYGNGILKALKLVDSPEFHPTKIKILKARKAPERRHFLGGIPLSYLGRSIYNKPIILESEIEEMLVSEINQLVYVDENLYEFQDIDFEDETQFDLKNEKGLLNKIIQSNYASSFLKSTLINTFNLNFSESSSRNGIEISNSPELACEYIESKNGDIKILSKNSSFKVNYKGGSKEGLGEYGTYVDELEIEVKPSSTRSFDKLELSLQLESSNTDLGSCLLLEEETESGEVIYKWDLGLNYQDGTRKGNSDLDEHKYDLGSTLSSSAETRGRNLFRKLKIKVFKWILPKAAKKALSGNSAILNDLVEPLGDNKYEILIFDLVNGDNSEFDNWHNIEKLDKKKILDEINKKSKKVLICFPGLFSTVEKGFDDLLEVKSNREELLINHCRYIIGFNIPTLFHGIALNAETVNANVENILGIQKIECNVLARSRGAILARFLFENQWKVNSAFVLNKLISFGPPNQGSQLASTENWGRLFNHATNVARYTIGSVAPVVPTILRALKVIVKGVTELPGINDLEEGSVLLSKLNNQNTHQDKYYIFVSNFEPKGILRFSFDEFLVDRAIFKGEKNDSIVPLAGALFLNEKFKTSIRLRSQQSYILSSNNTSHFSYLSDNGSNLLNSLFQLL